MNFTKYLPQFGALLLLMGLTVPAFSLAAGYLEKADDPASSTAAGNTDGPASTSGQGVSGGRPGVSTPNIPGQSAPSLPVYADNLSKVMGVSSVDGLTADRTKIALSDRIANYNRLLALTGQYTSGTALMETENYDPALWQITAGEVYDLPYANGSEVVVRYSKVESNFDASYTTVATPVTIARQSVKAYMGYLLISTENGTIVTLCDSFGNVLAGNIAGYEPYYARDFENRPVFIKDGLFFVFDPESAGMMSILEPSIRSGLFYDYPATPVYESGYEVKFDPDTGYEKFHYKKTNLFRFSAFFKAFNFSEGLAVIMQRTENFVRVINTSGTVQFNPNTWYSYHTGVVGQAMSVGDIYTLPDTFGIESMGVQGYDQGWLRLRVKTYSQNNQTRGKIVRDSYRLVNPKGKAFDIPEGYSLEGYSDGVLLLEKDGKYGYYTIDHKWIAQPMYTYATPFIQGLAVVGFADGTVGMIDTQGNIVLPFVFTTLSTPSSGVIVGYCEGIGYQRFYLSAIPGTGAVSTGEE